MVLYFHESDMLRESSLRFKVMLGSRDMYDVVFRRRRSETAGEADVPQELFAQSVIQTHDDKPAWTSLERRYAFHELCFVRYSSLQSEEQEQHRLWHKSTCEALNMWLELQYRIFKLRLL
jgi:hypothetical protein